MVAMISRPPLRLLSVLVGMFLCHSSSAEAQSPAFCFDVLKASLPVCTPRDEDYSDGAYSAWFNSLINVPSDQRCVYAANDGIVTFDPPKLKPGRAVKVSFTPQPFASALSEPLWGEFQVPVNIVLSSFRRLPQGCGAPPNYTLLRQPTSDADCTGNVCNYVFDFPQSTFAPGFFAAVIDYQGQFFNPVFQIWVGITGRMHVPVEVIENQLPIARVTATRITGLRYLISGLTSTDDEQLAEYRWMFSALADNDTRLKQAEFEYEFPNPGAYAIKLTVKDRDDEFSVVDEILTITNDLGVTPTPEPEVNFATLNTRVQALRSQIRQLRKAFPSSQRAKQSALRSAIRSAATDLREIVEENRSSIAVKNQKSDLRKLIINAQRAIGTLLRLRKSFSTDRRKANSALESFIKAVAR